MKLFKVFLFLIIIAALLYFVYGRLFSGYNRSMDNLVNQEIKGKVMDLQAGRSSVKIWLSEEEGYQLPYAQNHQYFHFSLHEFIQLSDSVYKQKGSDTLFIIRNNDKYFFVFGQLVR